MRYNFDKRKLRYTVFRTTDIVIVVQCNYSCHEEFTVSHNFFLGGQFHFRKIEIQFIRIFSR